MRTLIVFLLALGLAYSQDVEPEQKPFYLDSNHYFPAYLSAKMGYFKMNSFTLGWMWGDQPKITKSLFMNQKDIFSGEPYSGFSDSLLLFIRSENTYDSTKYYFYTHCAYESQAVYGKSLQYDPALYIDPADPYRLNIREGDTTNPVFGFLYRRGRVDTQNPNDSRLIIDSTSLIDSVILSDPWPAKMMYANIKNNDTTSDIYTGGRFYISINLRRYGNDNSYDNTPVLKIRVPYKYVTHRDATTYDSAYAKFDSVPKTNLSYFVLPKYKDSRIQELWRDSSKPTELIIRKSMLPPNEQDITISGFMIFDNSSQNNRKLRSHQDPNADGELGEIDSLKIEVTYLGGCSLSANWLRFETVNSRRIFFGVYDSLFAKSIQDDLDKYTVSPYKERGIKPSRFIINNEGSPINWGAERHFRRILGDIVTGSNGPWLPNHYDHYVNPADKWLSYSKYTPVIAVPFSKSSKPETEMIIFGSPLDTVFNYNAWKTLGFHQGFTKHPNNSSLDTLNSGYESFLASGLNCEDIRDADIATYRNHYNVNYIQNRVSPMAYFESGLWRFHVDGLLSGFEFSDKPWFPQMFIQSEIKFEDIYDSSGKKIGQSLLANDPSGNTYITGEMYRLNNWNTLIFGAKGLMYDGGKDYIDQVKIIPETAVLEQRELNYGAMSSIDFLTHNKFDNDFIDTTYNHICPTRGGMKNTIYDINTVAQYMGTRTDRLYIGKRSVRMEMYKLHQWIRQVEDDLMKLRLQAWYGYGYKLWYKQHPRFTQDSILWSYINPDSIKTRKIFDVDASGYKTTPPDYESTYDTFCDVTLLADTNDLNMRYSFTVGAQNRRTDPLIYFEEDTTKRQILFLSTAEFDYLCKHGGKNPLDTASPVYADTVWQKYYNRKFGCREITIPFNYVWDSQHPEDYALLHIRELGGDDSLLNVQDWRKDYNYDRVDTIIGQDKNLVIRLQPGEGKLMVVTVLPPPTLTGKLDYSNQRKLIAFPVDSANTYAYDSIRYHLVYHAVDPASNKIRVYYRRSLPVTRTTTTAGQENVIWLPTIADSLCLSMVIAPNCEAITYDTTRDCAYPSIVVRKDEDGNNKAFVVFTCRDNDSLSIVEAKIDIDSPNASFPTPRIIQRISGSDMDLYGTPMINAAANGNFYTWSDSTLGIGIGFKSTMTYCFGANDLDYIKFNQYQSARHPSLNSYSRINQNENQCALVWQEEFGIPNPPPMPPTFQSEICHARILWNNMSRLRLIEFNLKSPLNYVSFNNDSTIMRVVNFPVSSNHSNLPVVYRGLDGTIADDFDRIAWYDKRDQAVQCTGNPPYGAYESAIRYMAVDSKYTSPNDTNTISVPRKIIGGFRDPDLTFGTFEGTTSNNSEKAMILEFNSHNPCDDNNFENRVIWHIPHSFTTFLSGSSYTPESLTNARQLTGNGYLSHLAARQFQDGPEDWWKNRRVFMESDSTLNDSLKTSAQAFYKGKRDKVAIPFIGFYNYYASSFVSPFYIDGELIRFDVKDMFRTDCRDCRGTIIPDTIKTVWFRVSEANNLDYFIKGFETENVEMLLERKSNRQTVRVNVPRMSDTLMVPIRNLLINGRNNEYRLLFTKLDRFNYYTENLVIMEDPFEPIFRKQGGFDNIIDLGETEYSDQNDYLSIYPNPAEDKVFVTVSKPGAGSCRIELISALGQVVLTSSANISSSTEINIQGINPGLYMIRAYLPNGETLQNSFVLSR